MRTNVDVMRDIKSSPYRDIHGEKVLPGQFVCIGLDPNDNPIFAGVAITDGEFTIGGFAADDVFENCNVMVMGWVH
jgi:hypothetical protein